MPDVCLACGEPLAPTLALAAAVRCHDCRAAAAPLRAELVRGDDPAPTGPVGIAGPALPVPLWVERGMLAA
jgi:hypothetical protein